MLASIPPGCFWCSKNQRKILREFVSGKVKIIQKKILILFQIRYYVSGEKCTKWYTGDFL